MADQVFWLSFLTSSQPLSLARSVLFLRVVPVAFFKFFFHWYWRDKNTDRIAVAIILFFLIKFLLLFPYSSACVVLSFAMEPDSSPRPPTSRDIAWRHNTLRTHYFCVDFEKIRVGFTAKTWSWEFGQPDKHTEHKQSHFSQLFVTVVVLLLFFVVVTIITINIIVVFSAPWRQLSVRLDFVTPHPSLSPLFGVSPAPFHALWRHIYASAEGTTQACDWTDSGVEMTKSMWPSIDDEN